VLEAPYRSQAVGGLTYIRGRTNVYLLDTVGSMHYAYSMNTPALHQVFLRFRKALAEDRATQYGRALSETRYQKALAEYHTTQYDRALAEAHYQKALADYRVARYERALGEGRN
jgi:hypothetical protein